MQPDETILCILCNGFVSYKNKDSTIFEKHMNNEHMAYFGKEYLLAGCLITKEERLAVRDVVTDRTETEPTTDQNTTLEEETEDCKSIIKVEKDNKKTSFQCSHCLKAFNMTDNLEKHLKRIHPNKQRNQERMERKNPSNIRFLQDIISPVSTSKAKIDKTVQNLDSKKSLSFVAVKKGDVRRKSLTSTSLSPVTTTKENKEKVVQNLACNKRLSLFNADKKGDVRRKDLTTTSPGNTIKRSTRSSKKKITDSSTVDANEGLKIKIIEKSIEVLKIKLKLREPLERQISEGVKIRNSENDILMNDKEEWMQPAVMRLQATQEPGGGREGIRSRRRGTQ